METAAVHQELPKKSTVETVAVHRSEIHGGDAAESYGKKCTIILMNLCSCLAVCVAARVYAVVAVRGLCASCMCA